MADIFISYARGDRAVAASLAKAFEQCGWSVWWDRIIPPGKTFDELIEAQLRDSRCVVTLWSKAGIASRWVREEAQEAVNSGKFVPALLDAAEPPLGFRRIHAADLAGWRCNDDHPGWQDLKSAVSDLLGVPISSAASGTTSNFGGARATGLKQSSSGPEFSLHFGAWNAVSVLCGGLALLLLILALVGQIVASAPVVLGFGLLGLIAAVAWWRGRVTMQERTYRARSG